MASESEHKTSSLDSTHPVLVPEDAALLLADDKFEEHLRDLAFPKAQTALSAEPSNDGTPPGSVELDAKTETSPSNASSKKESTSFFMDALHSAIQTEPDIPNKADLAAENKTLTEKGGIAFKSTTDVRLDLFTELEKNIDTSRLNSLLEASWKVSPSDTLKIIWNARSIHLGKGEKDTLYRCLGWMRSHGHQKTLLLNLKWLPAAVIEKKVGQPKSTDQEDEIILVDEEGGTEDENTHLVKHGVAHGYWKDLSNLLVLEVSNSLNDSDDPVAILNAKNKQDSSREPGQTKRKRANSRSDAKVPKGQRGQAGIDFNAEQRADAREKRHAAEARRYKSFSDKWTGKVDHDSNHDTLDPFYRSLHMTVARLFARQLQEDMLLHKSGSKKDLRNISLAAKWAPSLEAFHDKSTLLASSIAEILYPRAALTPAFNQTTDSRETYLRHAREQYRRHTLSPLRKALAVVERDISAETFTNIDYQKVPSVAMDKYKGLFATKDFKRFEKFIENVASGKARISGAVLSPATLVKQVRESHEPGSPFDHEDKPPKDPKKAAEKLLKNQIAKIEMAAADGQWRALVQRIRDSGSLSDSIAVCDVSGSMTTIPLSDGTSPIDSAIGLSLLIAEVTAPPFGGSIITFDSDPEVIKVVDSSANPDQPETFSSRVRKIMAAGWGMTTNFIAVFERLILPLALKHRVKPADMVKQIFVFSDMQFDAAQPSDLRGGSDNSRAPWETHYERVRRKFNEAGYEVPRLVFWNLAGRGAEGGPKPVTGDLVGTALVSGYSQGQLKMFLDGGLFDEEEEGEAEGKDEDGDGDTVVVDRKTKVKKEMDPLGMMRKAIDHKAYSMLQVVD